ncbi:MAG: hypothetical protein ABI972_05215 [Acidobacteriota bacterium]
MLTPDQYDGATAAQLLDAYENAEIALDHRLLRALLAKMDGVAKWANDNVDNDILTEMLELFSQAPTPAAVPFLVEFARQYHDDIPEELIEALARLGAPALEPLLALYEEKKEEPGEVPFALVCLHVRDPRVDAVIEEVAAKDPEDAKFLREVYADDSGVSEPFDIFKQYPEQAAPDLRYLPIPKRLEFLTSEDVNYRLAAAASFIDTDLDRETAEPLITCARGDEHPMVRGLAWQALESRAKDHKALRQEMMQRLADAKADHDERGGIAVALASFMAEPEIRTAIEQLHTVPEGRARALEAMWRSFDKTFEAFVIPHIEDPDSEVRQQAILAAGYLGLGTEAARLEKQFTDPDFRDDALFSYALCCRAEVSRPFMKKLLRQIDKLAGGLDEEEVKTVMQALDLRLEMHGLKPVFSTEEGHEHE